MTIAVGWTQFGEFMKYSDVSSYMRKIETESFSYPSVLTYVFVARKNHLIESAVLSTHNISFD